MDVSKIASPSAVRESLPQDATKRCSKFDFMLHAKINDLKAKEDEEKRRLNGQHSAKSFS